MTTDDAHRVIRHMAALWPQMADLAENKPLRRVWVERLRKHRYEDVVGYLNDHRGKQEKPIRPEPGILKRVTREATPVAGKVAEPRPMYFVQYQGEPYWAVPDVIRVIPGFFTVEPSLAMARAGCDRLNAQHPTWVVRDFTRPPDNQYTNPMEQMCREKDEWRTAGTKR